MKAMLPMPDIMKALRFGVRQRCPHCGGAPSLHRYVKVVPECAACGEKLAHYRADDLPAYLTIFIAGHLMIPLIVAAETWANPGNWAFLLYPAVSLALVFAMLPRVKGMVLAWMWCVYRDQTQAEC